MLAFFLPSCFSAFGFLVCFLHRISLLPCRLFDFSFSLRCCLHVVSFSSASVTFPSVQLYTALSASSDVGDTSVCISSSRPRLKSTMHIGHILWRAFITWLRSRFLVVWTRGRSILVKGDAWEWHRNRLVLRWLRLLVGG